MGVDWVAMRPKPESSHDEIKTLIEEQAALFRQKSPSLIDEDIHYLSPSAPADKADEISVRYDEVWHALGDMLESEEYKEGGFITSWRVYPITGYRVFPPEWRLDAYRSFLPDELPYQVSLWKSYLEAVRTGYYLSYLLDLYLYVTSFELVKNIWEYLYVLAERSRNQTNRWATKPAFIEVREQVLSFEAPLVLKPPVFNKSMREQPRIQYQHSIRYKELMQKTFGLFNICREWNRRVPTNWKVRHYSYTTFEDFQNRADDNWLLEFLEWAAECCDRKFGFLLCS